VTLPTAVNADVSRTYKIWIVLGICLLLVGASFVISLTVGSRSTGFMDSLRVMPESLRYAFDSNYAANMAFNDLVVLIGGLRVPRTVLALLTGVALGGAGALIGHAIPLGHAGNGIHQLWVQRQAGAFPQLRCRAIRRRVWRSTACRRRPNSTRATLQAAATP